MRHDSPRPFPLPAAPPAAGFAIRRPSRGLAAALLVLAACAPQPSPELAAPRVIGAGVLSTAEIESGAAFLPDGTLLVARRGGVWGGPPEPARLVGYRPLADGGYVEAGVLFPGLPSATDPFVSPDGSRLVFVAPAAGDGRTDRDLWVADRWAGGWGAPRPLPEPVNSPHEEMGPSLDAAGVLYFSSTRPGGGGGGGGDLWRARPAAGGYLPPEPLGPPVSSAGGEWNALVSPAGDFLILEASGRPENVSPPGDLYLSWASGDGWTEPVPLAELNTAGSELNARLSPDGRWLLFASSRAGGPGEVDLYAVAAEPLLARYRPGSGGR